jgi:hypothetical protein
MTLERITGVTMTRSPESSQIRSALQVVCLLALLLLAGCGPGSGQGLDEDGDLLTTTPPAGAPPPGAPPPSGNPNATLAWVQSNVFGGVCSQCHIGAGAPFGVNWSSATNTCANVGRQSGEMATLKEIESGNPAASYVIWKVVGSGPAGEPIVPGRMPLNNPPLTADTIQNMRDWIADGVLGC